MNPKPIDIPFIGPSDSLPQDSPQWTRNWYAEKDGDIWTAKPTPGAVLEFEIDGAGGGRGAVSVAGRYFAVRGGAFVEVVDGATVFRGGLVSVTGKVGIVFNLPQNGAFQIGIVDALNMYVYDSSDDSFTILTAGGNGFYGGGSQVAFCAGRAVVFTPGTQTFWVSNLYNFLQFDGQTETGLQTLNTPILSVVANADLVYFFSADGYEVWQDQGNVPLNLRRVGTGRIGILAANSAVAYESFVYWLGRTEEGGGVVYRISKAGYPQRISDHTTERQIAAIADKSDCNAWAYQSLGHKFPLFNFTSGNTCIAFDETTQIWAERAWRYARTGAMYPPPYISICQHLGNLLALDYRNGNVYRVDENTFTDNGAPIRRDRIMSPIPENADWMTYVQSLELMGQIGNTPVGQEDPQYMLCYSVDRGMTYGQELWEQAGGNESYGARTKWTIGQAAISLTPWFAVVANQYVSMRNVRVRAQ